MGGGVRVVKERYMYVRILTAIILVMASISRQELNTRERSREMSFCAPWGVLRKSRATGVAASAVRGRVCDFRRARNFVLNWEDVSNKSAGSWTGDGYVCICHVIVLIPSLISRRQLNGRGERLSGAQSARRKPRKARITRKGRQLGRRSPSGTWSGACRPDQGA